MGKDKGVVKRGIIVADTHAPLHDKAACDIVIQAIKIVRPTIFCHLGDVGEFPGASHWQWRKKRRPPLEYQLPFVDSDIADANALMDEFDEALDKVGCKEKHICQGNHDLWLDYLVEENPFIPQYAFKKALRWKERGYKYHEAGDFLKIGKLNFYHGHLYAGIHHARNHLQNLGSNIMYGDRHGIQNYTMAQLDGAKAAWCIGCLKRLDREANEFTKGRPVDWSHGFAIVDFFDGGLFTVHQVQIVDGRTSLWGQTLYGKKAA